MGLNYSPLGVNTVADKKLQSAHYDHLKCFAVVLYVVDLIVINTFPMNMIDRMIDIAFYVLEIHVFKGYMLEYYL